MTQKETQLILEAFDQLNDILNDQMDNYWEDSFVWNAISEARTHVLQGRETLSRLFNRMLVDRG